MMTMSYPQPTLISRLPETAHPTFLVFHFLAILQPTVSSGTMPHISPADPATKQDFRQIPLRLSLWGQDTTLTAIF